MIFKKIFQLLWHFIDIICFLGALVAFNYAAFLMGGKPWLCIAAGISLVIAGLATEMINQKGGE